MDDDKALDSYLNPSLGQNKLCAPSTTGERPVARPYSFQEKRTLNVARSAFDSVGITIPAPVGSYKAVTGQQLQLKMPNGSVNTQGLRNPYIYIYIASASPSVIKQLLEDQESGPGVPSSSLNI